MKSIKLEINKEVVNFKGNKTEAILSDKDILLEVLNTPFEQGAKPSEIKQRLALIDKLEKATDVLELEDSEFSTIGSFLSNFSFGIVSKHIVNLSEKFNI